MGEQSTEGMGTPSPTNGTRSSWSNLCGRRKEPPRPDPTECRSITHGAAPGKRALVSGRSPFIPQGRLLPWTACVWVLLHTSCGDLRSPPLFTETKPAPLLCTMTPSEASAAVGDTVEFTVTVTDGPPSADATWSYAVSEAAVASVAATASGCRAVALSPGPPPSPQA